MIKFLIDFWSPKSVKLGSQNFPNGAQEGPKIIKYAILTKSKKVFFALEGWSKLRVGGSQDELLEPFLAF